LKPIQPLQCCLRILWDLCCRWFLRILQSLWDRYCLPILPILQSLWDL
jgi:hypothetical protein